MRPADTYEIQLRSSSIFASHKQTVAEHVTQTEPGKAKAGGHILARGTAGTGKNDAMHPASELNPPVARCPPPPPSPPNHALDRGKATRLGHPGYFIFQATR